MAADRRDDDLPELGDEVLAPPEGPALAADGRVQHDDGGPELDLEQIGAPVEQMVLEVDDAPPPASVRPVAEEVPAEAPAVERSLIAQAGESLRADSGRLLLTGLKAAAWLGVGGLLLGRAGVLAAVVGGALAGDVVIWFVIRLMELPRHLWAFQFEALINIGAVWLMLDAMHLFESFRQPEMLPFGLVAFFLVGLGRFVAYWVPRQMQT